MSKMKLGLKHWHCPFKSWNNQQRTLHPHLIQLFSHFGSCIYLIAQPWFLPIQYLLSLSSRRQEVGARNMFLPTLGKIWHLTTNRCRRSTLLTEPGFVTLACLTSFPTGGGSRQRPRQVLLFELERSTGEPASRRACLYTAAGVDMLRERERIWLCSSQ